MTPLTRRIRITLINQTLSILSLTIARPQISPTSNTIGRVEIIRRRGRRGWRSRRGAIERRRRWQCRPRADIPARLHDVFVVVAAVAPPFAVGDGGAGVLRIGGVVACYGRGRAGSRFGEPVGFELVFDGAFDGRVAGVARVEGTQAPAVFGLVPISTTAAPGGDTATVESGFGFLDGDVAISGGGGGGALPRDLPRVVEVPEVDFVEVGLGVDLFFVVGAGFAEAVAGEAGVDVDVADFGFVAVGFGDGFVEVVNFADAVVKGLAEGFAEVGVVVEGVDGWDAPVFVLAPGVVVGAEEAGVACEIEEEVGVVGRSGFLSENIIDRLREVVFHLVRGIDVGVGRRQGSCAFALLLVIAPVRFSIVVPWI